MNPRAVEAVVMMALGVMVVALRLHVRIGTAGWKKLQPDDYLMVLAAVIPPTHGVSCPDLTVVCLAGLRS